MLNRAFLFNSLILFIFCLYWPAQAQEQLAQTERQSDTAMDVTDGGPYAKETSQQQKDAEIAGVPALFRTPETGIGGGLVAVYLPPRNGTGKTSSVIGGLLYTEKRQFLSAIYAEKYFYHDLWVSELYLSTQDYPDSFFGIGNNTQSEAVESYRWRQNKLTASMRYLVTPNFRTGFNLVLEDHNFTGFGDDGQLGSGAIYGVAGGPNRGIGWSLRYDDQDNPFAPSEGKVLSVNYLKMSPFLGSHYDFSTWELNAKLFHSFSPKDILGVQTYIGLGQGDIPFFALYPLGGKNLLRGYFYGRYRDRNMFVAQAEWRRNLIGRFGAVVFAGAGLVSRELENIALSETKPGGGFGFRYQILEKSKINVRLDVGFGRDQPNPSTYLYILEAF